MRAFFEFDGKPVSFEHPREIIACYSPDDLPVCFDKIERALYDGYYVAGFLSYEAGYAFEQSVLYHDPADFPLLMMGVFSSSERERLCVKRSSFSVQDLRAGIAQDDYARDIARIHAYISTGDVYQITYCLKYFFSFRGSAEALYRRLLNYQSVPYPVYLKGDGYKLLSLSPEMFFKKEGNRLTTKPMKGSWPSDQGVFGSVLNGFRLHFDSKNRAENVMIADLLRNDLGRIGQDIYVPRLFEVARYRTIFQMTSTVCARIDKNLPFYNIFKSIFPSGSVTGAPKIQAMKTIYELEGAPRRIYTGAIGWITPKRDAYFNVPIRTLLLRNDEGEMGVGGGIVWDSTAEGEWAESLWKSRFLRDVCSMKS